MTALVAAEPVVRLPGAVARWDEQRVRAATGDRGTGSWSPRPGSTRTNARRVRDVENADDPDGRHRGQRRALQASPDDLPGWRARFATGDVTGPLLTLLADAARRADPAGPGRAALAGADRRRSWPPMVTDLRATGRHVGPGATLTKLPEKAASSAFPDGAWFVALPAQPYGEPLPAVRAGPDRLAPDQPIVVMYGDWIEYHGPARRSSPRWPGRASTPSSAAGSAGTTTRSRTCSATYLGQVTDVRYAGLFDRPLPYRPFDPLRVALPALPWLFAGCVAAFLVLSVRSCGRPAAAAAGDVGPAAPPRSGWPGLTALAVGDVAADRRPQRPGAGPGHRARCGPPGGLGEGLPDRHVRSCWPRRRPSWTTSPGTVRHARLPAGRLPAGQAVVSGA